MDIEIATSSNFDYQTLFLEGKEKIKLWAPDVSISDTILQELNRLQIEESRVVVSYEGVKIPTNLASDSIPIPTMWQFFLMTTMHTYFDRNKRVLSNSRIVDYNCASGFNGIYASVNSMPSRVWFLDSRRPNIEATIEAFELNTAQPHVRQRGRKKGKSYQFNAQGTEWFFAYGKPEKTLTKHKGDIFLAAPQWYPLSGVNCPYPRIAWSARKSGSRLFLAHSSLSKSRLEAYARNSKGILATIARREMPLTLDTRVGNFQISPSKEAIDQFTRDGLYDNGKRAKVRFTHDLCVSYLDW